MFIKKLALILTVVAPLTSWAAFTGSYMSPDGNNSMTVESLDVETFLVTIHKDDASSTCDASFKLRLDEKNPDKLFAPVKGCFVSVLTNDKWATLTAGGPNCDGYCSVGSLDTQGLKRK